MTDRDPEQTFSMATPRTGDPAPAARLVVVHPLDLVFEVALSGEPVVIGREGTYALRHRTVSRRHVELRWVRGTGHVVADLGSHNGSRVDGTKLGDRPVALADGSVVQLGEVFLVYEETFAQDAERESEALPGRSPAMHQLRAQVARAAPDPSPVLVLGETGTGKEWIARELHRRSKRGGALVSLNCAALSPQLVESQLFGHVRGAFTGATTSSEGLFQAADGGTLFLDEIGELPGDLQPKLLRVLQDHEVLAVGATRAVRVDVRVIAATNRDLASAVEQGSFRRDLHARLAMWEVDVPALRERRADLLGWLVRMHASWCAARGLSLSLPTLLPDAVEAILLAPWPDNLRGIDRLVHSLAALGARDAITAAELPGWLALRPQPPTPVTPPRDIPDRAEFVAAFEELGGNVSALARRFARDRRQIYRWIETHGCAAKK